MLQLPVAAHIPLTHDNEEQSAAVMQQLFGKLKLQACPATSQTPLMQLDGVLQSVSISQQPVSVEASHWPAMGLHRPTSQALPVELLHSVPAGAWLGWHTPATSQVSGSVQALMVESAHAVPAVANPLSVQLPAPSQASST